MSSPRPGTVEMVEISEPTRADAEAWDRFVASQPGANFCHLYGWKEVLEEALGCEALFRVARRGDGEWTGILPLVRVRSRIFGHYLVSLPFLNYGGPLGDADASRALAAWAVGHARESGADLLELRTRGEMEVTAGLQRHDRKVTVVLPLPDSAKQLFEKGFPGKLRSQIRRPMKEGMEVRFGMDQIDAFYAVFARNMRDLGTPVLPRSLFSAIASAFPKEAVFGAVYHEGQAVAAGAGFLYGGEFEMTWASSLREFNRLSPNMLLYWGFMEEMIGRGAATFNFGRCTPGGGTHKFKLQWGGQDVVLPWQQWSPNGADSTPSPDRPAYRAAVEAWQKLPLPVANLIGPFLAKRIP